MWGIFHHTYAKDAPLQTLVIFIAASKWILICYKECVWIVLYQDTQLTLSVFYMD